MLPLGTRVQSSITTSFLPMAAVGLPVRVESAGWVLPFHDEFRVWINQPGEGRTLQIRVTPAREICELNSLPLVAAGVIGCGEGFIVTGADGSGLPLVVGTAADGTSLWQHKIGDPTPFRWPTPGCGRTPVLLWQMEQGRVEVADVSANGVARRTSFTVEGPPLELAVARDSVWAAWSNSAGVFSLEATGREAKHFRLSETYASEIAVGACGDGICVAWGNTNSAFLARKAAGRPAFEEALELDLGTAAGGVIEIVPGDKPLLHARRAHLEEGEPARVWSVLTGPGLEPLVMDGLMHSVASSGETVVLLGERELRFFKLNP